MKKAFFKEHQGAAFGLVSANIFTLIFALIFNWDIADILWVYWGQSVTIGLFSIKRILSLKDFSTKNFKINKRSVKPSKSTKRQVAFFFTFHYGFFHLVYMAFLLSFSANLIFSQVISICICVFAFIFEQLQTHRKNVEFDQNTCPNIGTLMFLPYLRIVPMHLTIIFGGFCLSSGNSFLGSFVLILFLTLKTISYLVGFYIETYLTRKQPRAV